MIDLKNESPISLAAAARLLPPARKGRPVSVSCIYRWLSEGIVAPNGERVRLEAMRLGGRWLTSVAALERFARAQTPRYGDADDKPVMRTTVARNRAAERASRELERIGV